MLDQKSDDGIAFFYCNQGDPHHRTAENILRCYVKQLCKSKTDGAIQQVIVDKYNQNCSNGNPPRTLNDEESKEYLQKLFAAFPQVMLILDGLDECPEEEQDNVVFHLNSLVKWSLTKLKVLICGRSNARSTHQLEKKIRLSIDASDNQQDIRKFVEWRVSNHRGNPIPETLKGEIVNTICKNSDGM